MQMKVKKLRTEAIIPKYAHPGDAGLDLFAVEKMVIPSGETRLIHTGISVQLPEGTEGQVRPKSGLALKHSITVLNTSGTIDEGYRGEVGVILINHGNKSYVVQRGDKVAQFIVKPVLRIEVEEVKDLDDSERGAGSFGSTGG